MLSGQEPHRCGSALAAALCAALPQLCGHITSGLAGGPRGRDKSLALRCCG